MRGSVPRAAFLTSEARAACGLAINRSCTTIFSGRALSACVIGKCGASFIQVEVLPFLVPISMFSIVRLGTPDSAESRAWEILFAALALFRRCCGVFATIRSFP